MTVCSVEKCSKSVQARGWCWTHYLRWLKYGDPEAPTRYYGHGKTLPERFWDRVDKNGPVSRLGTKCWIWTGGCNRKGYGSISVGPTRMYTHRFVWQWEYGPIHRKVEVDHRCFNHSCVNPGHLRLASHKQNNENPSALQRNNTSGVRGVWWDKRRNCWTAGVHHHGRHFWVGRFKDLNEAEAAARAKRLELFTHNLLDRELDVLSS